MVLINQGFIRWPLLRMETLLLSTIHGHMIHQILETHQVKGLMYPQLINQDTNNIILVIHFSRYLTAKNVETIPSQEGQYRPHQHQPCAVQTMQVGLKGWAILTLPLGSKDEKEMAAPFVAFGTTLSRDKEAI